MYATILYSKLFYKEAVWETFAADDVTADSRALLVEPITLVIVSKNAIATAQLNKSK